MNQDITLKLAADEPRARSLVELARARSTTPEQVLERIIDEGLRHELICEIGSTREFGPISSQTAGMDDRELLEAMMAMSHSLRQSRWLHWAMALREWASMRGRSV